MEGKPVADIVIVNPRFDLSFWGMEKCMGLLGKRANLPVACLPLLAALVPRHHDVTLIETTLLQAVTVPELLMTPALTFMVPFWVAFTYAT